MLSETSEASIRYFGLKSTQRIANMTMCLKIKTNEFREPNQRKR